MIVKWMNNTRFINLSAETLQSLTSDESRWEQMVENQLDQDTFGFPLLSKQSISRSSWLESGCRKWKCSEGKLIFVRAFNIGRNKTQTVIDKTLPHVEFNDKWRQNWNERRRTGGSDLINASILTKGHFFTHSHREEMRSNHLLL